MGLFSAAAAGVGVRRRRPALGTLQGDAHIAHLDAAAVDEGHVHVEALTGCDRWHRRQPGIEGPRRRLRACRLRHGGEGDAEHGIERLGCLTFLRPQDERHLFVHCLADGAPQQPEGTSQRRGRAGRLRERERSHGCVYLAGDRPSVFRRCPAEQSSPGCGRCREA